MTDTADAPQEVLYEVADHIATITLNAPQRMNTISRPMLEQLGSALLRADNDPEVRCVILTGAGRAFCAGLDVTAQAQGRGMLRTEGPPRTTLDLRTTPPTVLHSMEKPVICAVNGGAAGYGMDLAIGCDIRIMARSAKMAAAFCKRGVLPESGSTWYLPRMIGWAKAAQLIFTGRTLSAAESLEWGLANEVVDDGHEQARARAIALEYTGTGIDRAVFDSAWAQSLPAFPKDLVIDAEGVATTFKVLEKLEGEAPKIDPRKVYRTDLAETATKAISSFVPKAP